MWYWLAALEISQLDRTQVIRIADRGEYFRLFYSPGENALFFFCKSGPIAIYVAQREAQNIGVKPPSDDQIEFWTQSRK